MRATAELIVDSSSRSILRRVDDHLQRVTRAGTLPSSGEGNQSSSSLETSARRRTPVTDVVPLRQRPVRELEHWRSAPFLLVGSEKISLEYLAEELFSARCECVPLFLRTVAHRGEYSLERGRPGDIPEDSTYRRKTVARPA